MPRAEGLPRRLPGLHPPWVPENLPSLCACLEFGLGWQGAGREIKTLNVPCVILGTGFYEICEAGSYLGFSVLMY